jgi:hypothetical protein
MHFGLNVIAQFSKRGKSVKTAGSDLCRALVAAFNDVDCIPHLIDIIEYFVLRFTDCNWFLFINRVASGYSYN